MDSKYLITVHEVSKKYKGRKALNNISFDVKKGEVIGIIGPNGAGKTTLISLLATINRPEAGRINIFGEDILKNPEKIRAGLGYVPQETALYPMLTAYENLDFWGGIYGVDDRLKKEKINRTLKLLRLEDRKNDKVKTFSGGMKKRLNIAASLLHDPEILIMDEPTAGVDILSRATIAELVLELKKSGRTIIITSHHIDDLEQLCDRILVLREGNLLYSGSAEEILRSTGNDNLEQLMLKLEEV
jgi:ABC-2 type transport system ATP-binding protein